MARDLHPPQNSSKQRHARGLGPRCALFLPERVHHVPFTALNWIHSPDGVASVPHVTPEGQHWPLCPTSPRRTSTALVPWHLDPHPVHPQACTDSQCGRGGRVEVLVTGWETEETATLVLHRGGAQGAVGALWVVATSTDASEGVTLHPKQVNCLGDIGPRSPTHLTCWRHSHLVKRVPRQEMVWEMRGWEGAPRAEVGAPLQLPITSDAQTALNMPVRF